MFTTPLRLQVQIFNLGVQSNLVYRWNFLMRVAVSFVPLLGSVFLWNAVFSGHKSFAGYTFESMVAYFITLIILDTMTTPNEDDFQIAEDIREGRINTLLLKPIDYRLYRFHLYAAARIVHSGFALIPLGISMIWLGHYYHGLPWLENLPWALLAIVGRGDDPVSFLFYAGDDCVLDSRYWKRNVHHLFDRVPAGRTHFSDRCVSGVAADRLHASAFRVRVFFPGGDCDRAHEWGRDGVGLCVAIGMDRLFLCAKRDSLEEGTEAVYGGGWIRSYSSGKE